MPDTFISIDKIEGVSSSDDGAAMLLKCNSGEAQVNLAIASDQLGALIGLTATSQTICQRIKNVDPKIKHAFDVTWWECALTKDSTDIVLTLSLSTDGKLSFRLDQTIVRALHEYLSTQVGESNYTGPDKPPH